MLIFVFFKSPFNYIKIVGVDMKPQTITVKISLLILFLFTILFSLNSSYAQKLDMEKINGIKARNIGPAGMSGRITAIDVVESEPDIIYVGTASGGLWRSKGGGTTWEPLFDEQAVASIGSLAIDQHVPDIIWAGTGEGNPRNSQTSGNGIYKSIDGGKTWKHLGLEKTRNIHRVIIDPDNSDIVYVGAQGSAWGDSEERGVFKTTDGGKTWKKILYVNEKTGIGDLVMDPSNPNKLIAAMWEFRRWPWFFKSGGEGSGLYITFDGGENWENRTDKDGLPKGELGRIGLAVAPSSPNIIYALVEAKENALYRSEDGGFKWQKTADKNIGNRPFYYADIFVDPKNENRIYNLYSGVDVSEDGGKTFSSFINWGSGVHSDHHAWWIHQNDPNYLIDGNDGGLAISRDRGKTWRFVENLPLAQFYHIRVDSDEPYNVYGGMQDNGSWRGPAEIFRSSGISNALWEMVSFGDGFDVVPYPENSRYGYSMSQGGSLVRYDVETGHNTYICPVHPDGIELRFNWNAGIAQDPFDAKTIYYGSQFLHKSTDMGNSWEIISPDLTTNDPEKQKQSESGGLTFDVTAAENFTTIITITPSPVKQGVIWVGTDDGNVQLTTDGGKTWNNKVKNIDGVPEGTWVPHMYASTYNAAEAFVVFDDHRRDNWTPYVYFTNDYGESWKRIVKEGDIYGYALSILQDPVEKNLLFLGTEFGLYVSIDAGKNWSKWTKGFPTVSTMDLAYKSGEDDLVIATFGRSAYIIDNIQPLREIASNGIEFMDKPLYLFDIPDASIEYFKWTPPGMNSPGNAEFKGENEIPGAMISYIVNPEEKNEKETGTENDTLKSSESKSDSVKIEIINSNGEVIRTLEKSPKAGLNRIYWGLDRRGVRNPDSPRPKGKDRERGGPDVLPGTYKVRITYGEFSDSTNINVGFDKRVEYSMADLTARDLFIDKILNRIEIATKAADQIRDAQETVKLVTNRMNDDEKYKELKKQSKAVQDSLQSLLNLIITPEAKGFKWDETVVSSRISNAYSYVRSSIEKPGQLAELSFKQANESLRNALDKINAYFNTDWMDFQKAVQDSGVSMFDTFSPIMIE